MKLEDEPVESPDEATSSSWSSKWSAFVVSLVHKPVLSMIHFLSNHAAKNPKITIVGVFVFSIAIFVLGFSFGMNVDVDEDVLWTPRGSPPLKHQDWIEEESGFPQDDQAFVMLFHQDGDRDLLGVDQVNRLFDAVDTVRGLQGYNELCATHHTGDCPISGVVKFWNNSRAVFQEQVGSSDRLAIEAMSAELYPDGAAVSIPDILGNPERDENGILTSAQMYAVTIGFPKDDEDAEEQPSTDFEDKALDAILKLRDDWKQEEGNQFRVELMAYRSFGDEFQRAIVNDVYLLPIVFVVMAAFTSLLFFKKNKVHSRCFLGFLAVVTVFLSIAAGFGLMFLCRVPFTSMTPILPFVLVGVGLDDIFIITASYFRRQRIEDPVERIKDTMDDIGVSVFLTKATSCIAFALGGVSTVPAIFWLCIYAVPSLAFIFLFELTFFVACLILDERRIQSNHRDCWRCLSKKHHDIGEPEERNEYSIFDSAMKRYGHQLVRPPFRLGVLVIFAALAGACIYSTTKLEHAFLFTDVLPSDSYITPFFDTWNDYSERSAVDTAAYFRFVDQSDPAIREQMEIYVNDLVSIDAIVEPPEFFWINALQEYLVKNPYIQGFNNQVEAFLKDDANDYYRNHIVLNGDGSIATSRVILYMDRVDFEDVRSQIEALEDQRAVSERQEINENREDLAFFTYNGNYNIWEFYRVSAKEIIITTISSVIAVSVLTLLMVPHWTAVLYTLPLLSVLYIDLMGALQWFGADINPITYVTLVMSVGLLIDFLLHILLRYYETSGDRKTRTITMLKTMGSSIAMGAATTFLGILPLAFSSSNIFKTVFYAFVALVVLGSLHGLVLLPVLLSLFGTTEDIASFTRSEAPTPSVENKAQTLQKPQAQTPTGAGETDSVATI